MTSLRWLLIAALVGLMPGGGAAAQGAAQKGTSGPTLVIETVKGAIEIQMFPADAPKTVEHITALAKRNFYNGHRIHRVVKGFVVQFGDPQSRDMTKRDRWGSQGSGRPIGATEIKRRHGRGAVAVAHSGDPKQADSQMYITLAPQPNLDGKFTVFGQVVSGMDVAGQLAVNDIVRRVTVKP